MMTWHKRDLAGSRDGEDWSAALPHTPTMFSLAARRSARVVAASPRGILARGYHENIVEHYENPRNVGSLDKSDETVGTVRELHWQQRCCSRLQPTVRLLRCFLNTCLRRFKLF